MNISSMNEGKPGLHPDFENVIRRQKVERQVTAIVLGLTLVTGGNGAAMATMDQQKSDDTASSDSLSASSGYNPTTERTSEPTDPTKPAERTTLLISNPKPWPDFFFQPPAPEKPQPKPAVVLPSVIPQPTPKRLAKPPVSSLRKRQAGFTAAEIRPISDTTKKNIDTMELSVERYQTFINTIDISHLDFAQQYTPFNPNKVNIDQNKTEFFTLHYTAFYSNFGESSKTQPAGDMDVRKLVDTMGARGDTCCGINWILARDGRVFQTAPTAAKLRHNPPFDSLNTGVEVEASDQDSITPNQYETLGYLAIAVLKHQGLIDQPLERTIHGHGEDRDRLRQTNPNTKWETRNDFDAATSKYFRSKVGLFLKENPGIAKISVPFQ